MHVLKMLDRVDAPGLPVSMEMLCGVWRLIYSSGFNGGSLGGSRPGPPAPLVPAVLGQVYQDIRADGVSNSSNSGRVKQGCQGLWATGVLRALGRGELTQSSSCCITYIISGFSTYHLLDQGNTAVIAAGSANVPPCKDSMLSSSSAAAATAAAAAAVCLFPAVDAARQHR
jgi:hypothetical protein